MDELPQPGGSLMIYDVQGRIMREQSLSQPSSLWRAELGDLPEGLYLVVLRQGGAGAGAAEAFAHALILVGPRHAVALSDVSNRRRPWFSGFPSRCGLIGGGKTRAATCCSRSQAATRRWPR